MKKSLLLFTAIIALSATTAQAEESLYGRFMGGANWLTVSRHNASVDLKPGYMIGGALGYKWCNNVRLEGEISYRRNDLRKGHLHLEDSLSLENDRLHGHYRSIAYMGNVVYDIPIDCSYWTLSLGAGAGYADQRLVLNGAETSDESIHVGHSRKKGFAAQGMATLGYNFCEDMHLEIGYTYHYVWNDLKAQNNGLVISLQGGF